ncbi:MAG TPA: diguanylate cyclase [Solimonas sp.]|nr:diguanylate cyclase [Solimonas sp.]
MTTASNDIVILSRAAVAVPRLIGGRSAQLFSDFRAFRESGLRPGAIILRGDDALQSAALLRQLRRDPDHATRLVFVDGALDEADAALSDGRLPSAQQLLERIDEAAGRAQAMHGKGDDRSAPALLLEYLWLRPGQVLEPMADWRHPRRWRYPLLEMYDRGGGDPHDCLQQLDRDGLLERVQLKARQRECDFCGSAQLGFIDVCPSCRSIDIDQHAALHCFTCGLVAPEERYVRGGQRICPKCGAQLRHIGTDYDRPLETGSCGSCQHIFVEGEVVATCMVCLHTMAPTALRLHRIHSWRLSSRGCLAAQGGEAATRALFDEMHYASREHFIASLDWLLKLAQGQRQAGIGLIGLRLRNGAALNHALGASRVARLVEAFADRLRELQGEAELATRADAETFWMLLPVGERKRLAELREALSQLEQHSRQPEGPGPEWVAAELFVNGPALQQTTAESLLAQLQAALPVAAPAAARAA